MWKLNVKPRTPWCAPRVSCECECPSSLKPSALLTLEPKNLSWSLRCSPDVIAMNILYLGRGEKLSLWPHPPCRGPAKVMCSKVFVICGLHRWTVWTPSYEKRGLTGEQECAVVLCENAIWFLESCPKLFRGNEHLSCVVWKCHFWGHQADITDSISSEFLGGLAFP